MEVADDFSDLIGSTPLVRLNSVTADVEGEVLAKLEYSNPGGSVKDRIAAAMLDRAEKQGEITAETTVVEPTSGNTGIGLASVCASRGYRLVLTMPESMSKERRSLLSALGAELVLTSADGGMNGAVEKAEEIVAESDDAFMPQQFKNPANPQIHRETTGPEIWADTDGEIDVFVGGIGTGGTITGVGSYLKDQDKEIYNVGVEPAESPVLSGGKPGPHKIQGIGAGFVPEILDTSVLDEVFCVEDEEALATARRVANEEGLLIGISSGAAVAATLKLARRTESQDQTFVVVIPDSGERYLSTRLYQSEV